MMMHRNLQSSRVIPTHFVKNIEFKNKRFVKTVLQHLSRKIRDGDHVFQIKGREDLSENQVFTVVDLHIKSKKYRLLHVNHILKTLPKEKILELKWNSSLKNNQAKLNKLVKAGIVEKVDSIYWYEGKHLVPTDRHNWFRAETRENITSRCFLARFFAPTDKRDELLKEARSLDRWENKLLGKKM